MVFWESMFIDQALREKQVERARDLAAEQPLSPSPLAASASQRHHDFRSKLRVSRAQRKLYGRGTSHRFGLIYYLPVQVTVLTSYVQCIGEQYSATGQSRVIYFSKYDMASTRDCRKLERHTCGPRCEPTQDLRLPYRNRCRPTKPIR